MGRVHERDIIWAPWRMVYIVNPKKGECIFCTKPEAESDEENWIVARFERVFVILNAYPYNNGHLMVVPYRHVASLAGLEDGELSEMMFVTRECERALSEVLRADGFNIGINIGRVAGAGIDEHVHIHVVPRWNGDTNFMTTLADMRVIPELLQTTYAKLKPWFERNCKVSRRLRT